MKKIYAFGDSITFGMGADTNGGWVSLLNEKLQKESKDIEIINKGVPGDTSKDLLERIEESLLYTNPYVVIIAIGINDAQFISFTKNFLVPIEIFENNLMRLVEKVQKFTKNIVFVGLINVDETKVAPVTMNDYIYFYNSKIELFDAKIKEVAYKNNLHFVELFGLLNSNDLSDGLHPNEAGYKKIADKISDFLKNKNIV